MIFETEKPIHGLWLNQCSLRLSKFRDCTCYYFDGRKELEKKWGPVAIYFGPRLRVYSKENSR